MRGRRLLGAVGDVNPDMTPMIDCVFQLMIFFILCTEVAAHELEKLELPPASEAVADKPTLDARLTLNVTPAGEVRFRGRTLDPAALRTLLALEARIRPDPADPTKTTLGVLIRGDADAEYRHVRQVLMACAAAQIWRVEVAAREPGKGEEETR